MHYPLLVLSLITGFLFHLLDGVREGVCVCITAVLTIMVQCLYEAYPSLEHYLAAMLIFYILLRFFPRNSTHVSNVTTRGGSVDASIGKTVIYNYPQ